MSSKDIQKVKINLNPLGKSSLHLQNDSSIIIKQGKTHFYKSRTNVNKSDGHGKFFTPCHRGYKRRFSCQGERDNYGARSFKKRRKSLIITPNKFLMGGNITDPLNLNSLADEEINRMLNEVTPKSSPMPTPQHRRQQVEVIIPPNINDPLNLNSGEDIDLNLISPKIGKRKKHRKKKHDGKNNKGESMEPIEDKVVVKDLSKNEDTEKIPMRKEKRLEDKIVSPVIPQGPQIYSRTKNKWRRPSGIRSISRSVSGESKRFQEQKVQNIKFRKKNESFQYGNYSRYYGYRNPNQEQDYRLKCLRKEWFENKDVLDIGCNVGYLTLSIAKDFSPKKVIGLDIDGKLIATAKKNVRHYLSNEIVVKNRFPISMAICFGPIAAPTLPGKDETKFPNNIFFVEGNYVLESDNLLDLQKQEYDTIVCLSLTKWIHLNWGDDGLKRTFKRIYRQLQPGGHLILEAQSWNSYNHRKRLTETIYRNYLNISLRPEKFTEYLLSKEVGFSTCEVIDVPFNKSLGFRRPIHLLTKSTTTTNSQINTSPTTKVELNS